MAVTEETEQEARTAQCNIRLTDRQSQMVEEMAADDDRSFSYIVRVIFEPALEAAYRSHLEKVAMRRAA